MSSTYRVAVLTGATGGIGRWIALGLARADYHLVIICRDRARGAALEQWLVQQMASTPRIDFHIADLASLAQTRRVGEEIAQAYPAISLLINNAGIFRASWQKTSEGREAVLAVNHLSPFLLTEVLEGALRAGTPSRIVNVGSSTADTGTLDPHQLERGRGAGLPVWGMVRAYRESKLAMMVSTFARAKRLADSGVVTNVVHPGTVASGLIRERGAIGLAWKIMAPFCLTEEEGARTPLFVALDPDGSTLNGKYVKQCAVVKSNPCAADQALQREVDVATRALIDGTFAATRHDLA